MIKGKTSIGHESRGRKPVLTDYEGAITQAVLMCVLRKLRVSFWNERQRWQHGLYIKQALPASKQERATAE